MATDEHPNREPYTARVLTPLFFTPTILIFPLPVKLPEGIKKPLLEAFSLYWSNPGASGNSLRIAVEALMDNQRVRKSERLSGKRRLRQLHHRIEEFAKTKPEIGQKLLAIKWLGNSGSHLGGLKPEHVVTGFKLMESAILRLFDRQSQHLTSIAKKIIQRKGPV
jgi:hypothetical protein